MAEITAQLVKTLRERTGAGMMECKSALTEAKGDLSEAEIVLRKRGIASATKKSSRTTKQGLIEPYTQADGQLAVLVEVNCESDFVARTEDFITLAKDMAYHIAEADPQFIKGTEAPAEHLKKALYEQNYKSDGQLTGSLTIDQHIKTKIAKLGENIAVTRFTRIHVVPHHGIAAVYIHPGGQLGTMVELTSQNAASAATEEFRGLAHDLAMHIAAADPQFISRADVDQPALDKERDIQRARALAEGKPEKVVDKMVEGRMAKYYEEVCLLEQPFVKENTLTIEQLLKSKFKGETITVARFVRYKVGDTAAEAGQSE
ncbi:MAG TPA: translation elongation factor Ts [Solibacterales bacterium]|nr:translation elongation factor Ts [Bryobacterales bacterium]